MRFAKGAVAVLAATMMVVAAQAAMATTVARSAH